MSPGTTFERVYDELRRRIMTGGFRPGARLEPGSLSETLSASITPVRDALHRLVGERLVAAPRTEGFQMPMLTERRLRDLHAWNGALLALSLRGPRLRERLVAGGARPTSLGADYADRGGALFVAIAELSRIMEHGRAVANLNARLHFARLIEARLIPEAEAELDALERLHAAADVAGLRKAVLAYHRRRDRLTAIVVAAVQDLD